MLQTIRKGFTLIELMIVVAMIAIVAAVAIPPLANIFYGGGDTAEEAAREYTTGMYPDWEIAGLSCPDQDTDGDGYISCDVRITRSEQEKTLLLACAAGMSSVGNSGCKVRPAVVNQNNGG